MVEVPTVIVAAESKLVGELSSLLRELGYPSTAVAPDQLSPEAIAAAAGDSGSGSRPIMLVNIESDKGTGFAIAETLSKDYGCAVVALVDSPAESLVSRLLAIDLFGMVFSPLEPLGLKAALELALRRIESEQCSQDRLGRLEGTLRAIADGVISADPEGRVVEMNSAAERLTGWGRAEAAGQPLDQVLPRDPDGEQASRQGGDGCKGAVAVSVSPLRDQAGKEQGAVALLRDQSEQALALRYAEMRLSLIEYAKDHSLEQLLTRALDLVGDFVDSPIGFYHFVEPDQKTLSLQQWSTRTLKEFCQLDGSGMHYPIEEAGVWVDCVRHGRPVVHNDYAALPHRKGLPKGHAPVTRELVVPVMRDNRMVAILGVGNKALDYTEADLEAVRYLADVTWAIVAAKRTKKELENALADWEKTFDAVNAAIWILDKEQRIVRSNRAAEEIFDHPCSQMIGQRCHVVAHGTTECTEHCPVLQAKKSLRREMVELETDESWFEVVADPILGKDREFLGVVHIVTDITERKLKEQEREQLRERLSQAQKMESIGRLAGGIAHDFNNMLGVIVGYTDLILENPQLPEAVRGDLVQVQGAAESSVSLVRQLLTFARKQVVQPRVVELNTTIQGILKMLKRLIGEEIELSWQPGVVPLPVKLDPAQLDQVLTNLCVNSRDAIDGTGRIVIRTEGIVLAGADQLDPSTAVEQDCYALLTVSDDGRGMDAATLDRVFEPFFTTKELHLGTGLGLATVYGIVQQSGGFVRTRSAPNQGTTFELYFPCCREVEDSSEPEQGREGNLAGAGESILLVEDEEAILALSKEILEESGYSVLAAATPALAYERALHHEGELELMVTDVVLPEMNGKELGEKIRELYPDLKIIYISGYTENIIEHRGVSEGEVNFLQKPFTVQALRKKVRQVLG
ncbi:GAF domain-containing protein [Desulfogranum mediterraneum]|uniref:GAF domain-containing protein n=1 Tax=Desulfogranum mediterraneum TaxID=160661 RepID=UPI0004108EC9|nr:GAF domain-containing protein [Desulfogranum mediterraneum]